MASAEAAHLFGKLYAKTHLRADRWYKLGRELLYGRLEDEKPFHSVRRLVQQEDYALHKLYLAGLPPHDRTVSWNSAPNANTCWGPNSSKGPSSSATPKSTTASHMILCLALRSTPEQVYERALRKFTVQ